MTDNDILYNLFERDIENKHQYISNEEIIKTIIARFYEVKVNFYGGNYLNDIHNKIIAPLEHKKIISMVSDGLSWKTVAFSNEEDYMKFIKETNKREVFVRFHNYLNVPFVDLKIKKEEVEKLDNVIKISCRFLLLRCDKQYTLVRYFVRKNKYDFIMPIFEEIKELNRVETIDIKSEENNVKNTQ